MEPIIRAETDEEIIVVFCNRCGIEDDTVYAGTSTVIGIKGGEVSVYGLLGRCQKSLLVVDTDTSPLGKLVLRTESATVPEGNDTLAGENGLPLETGANPGGHEAARTS